MKNRNIAEKVINPELTEVVFEGNIMVKPKHEQSSDELFISNQVSQDGTVERNSKKQKKRP